MLDSRGGCLCVSRVADQLCSPRLGTHVCFRVEYCALYFPGRLHPRFIQQEFLPMGHAVIVLAAVSCLSVLARGQSAEELVNKNIQAKGGMDKIKAIKTVRMTGKLNGGGGFPAARRQKKEP